MCVGTQFNTSTTELASFVGLHLSFCRLQHEKLRSVAWERGYYRMGPGMRNVCLLQSLLHGTIHVSAGTVRACTYM